MPSNANRNCSPSGRSKESTASWAQLAVDSLLLPEGLQFRFALDGIGAHAETRLQQVERVFVGGTSLGGGVALLLAHGVPALASGLSVLALLGCGIRGWDRLGAGHF